MDIDDDTWSTPGEKFGGKIDYVSGMCHGGTVRFGALRLVVFRDRDDAVSLDGGKTWNQPVS